MDLVTDKDNYVKAIIIWSKFWSTNDFYTPKLGGMC